MNPTPMSQRSGRLILEDLVVGVELAKDDTYNEDLDKAKTDVERQLFNAMMEIVGRDQPVFIKPNRHMVSNETRNLFRAELRQKLAAFFNQPEKSGKDGDA